MSRNDFPVPYIHLNNPPATCDAPAAPKASLAPAPFRLAAMNPAGNVNSLGTRKQGFLSFSARSTACKTQSICLPIRSVAVGMMQQEKPWARVTHRHSCPGTTPSLGCSSFSKVWIQHRGRTPSWELFHITFLLFSLILSMGKEILVVSPFSLNQPLAKSIPEFASAEQVHCQTFFSKCINWTRLPSIACTKVSCFVGFFLMRRLGLVLFSSDAMVFLGQVFLCSHMKFQFGQNAQWGS